MFHNAHSLMVLYTGVIAAFGYIMLLIGIWGFARRRLLIVYNFYLGWAVLAAAAFLEINLLITFSEGTYRHDPLSWLLILISLAVFLLIIYIYWRRGYGYIVIGVSKETFHSGLTGALNKLNLPFRETFNGVKLLSLGADLQGKVFEWIGTADLRMKGREKADYTAEIANVMKEYLQSNAVKVNFFSFALYLFIGIVIIFFVIALALLLSWGTR